MTFCAELTAGSLDQIGIVRTVSVVASGAFLSGWRVQCAIPPIFGNLSMTAEAKGGLAFYLVPGVRRTMAIVTDDTLHLCHRFVLDFKSSHLVFDIRMAVETYLSRLPFNQIGLIRSMIAVAGETIAVGKG